MYSCYESTRPHLDPSQRIRLKSVLTAVKCYNRIKLYMYNREQARCRGEVPASACTSIQDRLSGSPAPFMHGRRQGSRRVATYLRLPNPKTP